MLIEFVTRSSFIKACEQGIRAETEALRSGQLVCITLGSGGYDATVRIFIDHMNRDSFDTNWSSSDPTRFPARIRAAATALRNCGITGPMEIAHRNGKLIVQMMLAEPQSMSNSPSARGTERDNITASPHCQEVRRADHSLHPPGSTPDQVVLVSCVSAKLSEASRAKDLYTSPWFLKARRYAEASGCPWFILSAEHGLLHPESTIAPYEKTLNTMPIAERRAWASRVLRQMDEFLPAVSTVVFLAGERYRELLLPNLSSKNVRYTIPMAGLRIGEQLGWLEDQAREKSA